MTMTPTDQQFGEVYATVKARPILEHIRRKHPDYYAEIVLAVMRQREAWGQGDLPAG